MTAAYHVPRNDALAATSSELPEASSVWSVYLREWTRANHFRTAAAFVATASLLVAIVQG